MHIALFRLRSYEESLPLAALARMSSAAATMACRALTEAAESPAVGADTSSNSDGTAGKHRQSLELRLQLAIEAFD